MLRILPAASRTPFFVHLRTLSLLALAATVACYRGTGASGPVQPSERFRFALSPASFAGSVSLQQRVRVEQNGRNVEIDAVLEISPDSITLVGLGFGQRLFTLRYDGKELKEARSPMLPREVQGSDILSDMQLALWPTEAVRAALPSGVSLRDETNSRTLSQNGATTTAVTYAATPRWKGVVTIVNSQYGYRLVISPAPDSR